MFSPRLRPLLFGLLLSAVCVPSSWHFAHTLTTARAEPDQRRPRVYLAELAMLIEGARRLLLWTETYIGEPEFARFAHPMAEGYVDMAGRLVPPEKLINAHPHLLMVVENVERALDAAAAGDTPAFRQRARIVREELLTLDSVLKQLKLRLPELAR
jgi:hypothetical protein